MYLLNTIFLIVGIGISILGAVSFFIPALTRFINSPGGPKFKAVISMSIGIFFILLSLFVEMPIE